MARIGDFREVLLPRLYPDKGHAPPEAREDGVAGDEGTVLRALQLSCWLNTQEKALFSAPYECRDCDAKFVHFLDALGPALDALPPAEEWEEEFDQVMSGIAAVEQEGSVERHKDVGVAIVRAPRQLHYYSLFSFAVGCDVVLSIMPEQRYEVECRYSQYVCFNSRPVALRLSLLPLAKVCNALEAGNGVLRWGAARFTDTGPILRLDDPNAKLSKRELYGHPCERRVHSSSIPPERFERLVLSYFEHGLRNHPARCGGWSWDEMHTINKAIDWSVWERSALADSLTV